MANATAAGWQDEPEARQQLHQLGLELALADVHPDIRLWWQQATTPATASDQADDRLLLGLQSFWRHWSTLSFNERQYLHTKRLALSFSDADKAELRLAGELGQREQLVQKLTPGYADPRLLQQQLTRLLTLKNEPWPLLQAATLRPNEHNPVVDSIRTRLQLLGDMPEELAVQVSEPDPGLDDAAMAYGQSVASEESINAGASLAADASITPDMASELAILAGSMPDALQTPDADISRPPRQISDPEHYDAALVEGVRRFQARHGLTVDGVIGPQTYAWLNTSPLKRSQLLMRSMMRTLISDALPSSYLLVNIPEYHLRLYQHQVVVLESSVIVGQDQRKTPIMSSKITSVVFNPPWNVPRSIIDKDILPKLHLDPDYLDRQGFEVLDSSGTEVIPRAEWQARLEDGGGFPYRLRQRPGSSNALGAYKFHLPNNDAIYLHDTPTRGLFARDSRALSSGCVRVEGAERLADWLLHDQLSQQRLAALKASAETRWVKVAQPLPLFMVYWPSWLGEDGRPHYRNDIYGFDKTLTSPFSAG